MIAVDTNVLRRYLRGVIDGQTAMLAEAINTGEAYLPPVALTEALSDRDLRDDDFEVTRSLPLLQLYYGYWFRAGSLRRKLAARSRSAPIADCLIAQACIDVNVPLLTFDDGFTRFIDFGLQLIEV
ncbi:MAG TPA: PIN domain-containing protein [Thermoanaerobaculia bacterium]|nr:PIN domain-containing protein [Thermoanaerobaculia bacterium]